MSSKLKKGLAIGLLVFAAVALLVAAVMPPCWGALARWGLLTPRCPAGEPRVLVDVSSYGVERGREGTVSVNVWGSYIDPRLGYDRSSPLNRFDWEMELEANGTVHPLACAGDEHSARGYRSCQVELPQVPDGDHVLRVRVDTPLEDPVVELPLPLYAPAHVHVLTDRPLYEPGNVVLFRSLTLRRGSLEPLDERPGTWVVTDPNGEVLLEQRQPGGPWGVEHSSFPLAMDATPGAWTVTWRTGDDSGSASFDVRPFTLPRSTVEASPLQSWYGPGEEPLVRGVVSYTSGAPVQGATVQLTLRSDGEWPPPNDWLGPHLLRTDASGSFSLRLPPVPEDLHARSAVGVAIQVTDTDGDTVRGGTSLLLSPDPLQVDAVTELADGLVPDFNNRVYLRVTHPDGRPLTDTEVFLKNAWDVRDEGRTYTTDADGVLAAQVDPGQPVNLVVPAPPVRPAPRSEVLPVRLQSSRELLGGRGPNLQEARQLELMTEALAGCARFGAATVNVAAQVRGGLVRELSHDDTLRERCVADALVGEVLGVGEGVWSLSWTFSEPQDQTWLRLERRDHRAGPVGELLELARRDATACVAHREVDAVAPWSLVWSVPEGQTRLRARWTDNPGGAGAWPEQRCVQAAFEALELEQPAEQELLGVVHLSVDAWRPAAPQGPRTRTETGFEYLVSVQGVGQTSWRSQPGAVPDLRLRAAKVLLEPGEGVAIELLRGPGWIGELPSELTLSGHEGVVQICPRTEEVRKGAPERYEGCPAPSESNTIAFQPPSDQTGFMQVEYAGARAMVYVQPTAELELDLSTAMSSYAPGAEAVLVVQASQPAVVSLVGVDSTLAQLAPLPDEGELSRHLVAASSSAPAYGVWDAVALTSGRIRGSYAAMAAIQRVDSLVLAETELPWVSLSASSGFDPVEETTSTFWELLGDLHDAVRRWEGEAPDTELLTNEKLAELYAEVLDAREEQGLPMTDPWGRRLELYLLSEELLRMCEPRVLVLDATRVPEDVVNWTHWVYAEMER